MNVCGGWNSLYWSNHDQARAVTRFGDESPEYRVVSAKMLGTALHMLQGTPYIYEGEEIGMTNAFSIKSKTIAMWKHWIFSKISPEEKVFLQKTHWNFCV